MDLLVNKVLEMRNSQLIFTYCHLDARFRKLSMVLKNWQKSISPDSKAQRLNSYSIYLLLLAFMIEKQYLPNL